MNAGRLQALMLALIVGSCLAYLAANPEPQVSERLSPHRKAGKGPVSPRTSLSDNLEAPVAAAAMSEPVVVRAQGVPTTTNATVSAETTTGSDPIWYALADCESGSWNADGQPIPGTANWQAQGGGHEGGLQFAPSTWLLAGGDVFAPHAYQATPDEQIIVAMAWLSKTSPDQWPVCSRKVGLTMADGL